MTAPFDTHLPVRRADVRLHRVDAEIAHAGDVLVGLRGAALGGDGLVTGDAQFGEGAIDEVRWIITNDEATVRSLAASGELTMTSQYQSPETYKALEDMGIEDLMKKLEELN